VADYVVIGMDPHKRSAAIEGMAADETIRGGGRYATDAVGYRSMLTYAKQWPDRTWAIEGSNGAGRHIAIRLVSDGETVVDVPAKLSARARGFVSGQGRKTDAWDSHSVALVGTRTQGLHPVVNDEQRTVLRILVDRRRALGEDHTRMTSQLHSLLLELIPGGAKKDLSAAQAKKLLATVRPRDGAGKARHRVAVELVGDLERIYAQESREQRAQRAARRHCQQPHHTYRHRPSGAARLLVEVGDIHRFPTRAHFASWNGTAPLDASSGEQAPALTPAIVRSTASCTSWPSCNCATRPKAAPSSTAASPKARHQRGDASTQTQALRQRLPTDDPRRQTR
jgi:transposase